MIELLRRRMRSLGLRVVADAHTPFGSDRAGWTRSLIAVPLCRVRDRRPLVHRVDLALAAVERLVATAAPSGSALRAAIDSYLLVAPGPDYAPMIGAAADMIEREAQQ